MSADKILILTLSALGIVLTYWFFLMKKTKGVIANGFIDIKVEGGYNPEVISIPLGKKTTVNFLRTDSNSCLEEVNIPDFKIKKFLPMNKKVALELRPSKRGEFGYSCSMNMFHGKIVVK